MHYYRSRTYAQKLELQLTGITFRKVDLFIEVKAELKNIGVARHTLNKKGNFCEVVAIFADMTRQELRFTRIFEHSVAVESGETVHDLIYLKVNAIRSDIIWVHINLRVTGEQVEWNESVLLKVD